MENVDFFFRGTREQVHPSLGGPYYSVKRYKQKLCFVTLEFSKYLYLYLFSGKNMKNVVIISEICSVLK